MARTTVADLEARLDAMQEEIDSLRAHIDSQAAASNLSFVVTREAHAAPALPSPINFREMADDQGLAYAYPDMYWDPDYWGANAYL